MINFDRIRQAAAGQLGPDQQRLVTTGLEIVDTLLRKNTDYGNSAWTTPVLAPNVSVRDAIQCRMSDKIARLNRLLAGNTPQVAESVEDTMRDLAGYAILWLGAERVAERVTTNACSEPCSVPFSTVDSTPCNELLRREKDIEDVVADATLGDCVVKMFPDIRLVSEGL